MSLPEFFFSKILIMNNKILIAFVVLLTLSSSTMAQQRTGSLSGQVTDELGALVVGATVTVISSNNSEKSAVTSNEGIYTFNSLAPGRYTLKVVSAGFSDYSNSEVEVKTAAPNRHDVHLAIAVAREVVTVDNSRRLNTDSENNADALVLRGADIDVLPDDPNDPATAGINQIIHQQNFSCLQLRRVHALLVCEIAAINWNSQTLHRAPQVSFLTGVPKYNRSGSYRRPSTAHRQLALLFHLAPFSSSCAF